MNTSPNLFVLIVAYAAIAVVAIICMIKILKESEGGDNDKS